MKSSKVLLKAMNVIATPDKWTKNEYARDKDGRGVLNIQGKEAVCFCALGAIRRTGDYYNSDAGIYLEKSMPRTNVPTFNDSKKTTHSDVMEKFMTAYFLAVADGD